MAKFDGMRDKQDKNLSRVTNQTWYNKVAIEKGTGGGETPSNIFNGPITVLNEEGGLNPDIFSGTPIAEGQIVPFVPFAPRVIFAWTTSFPPNPAFEGCYVASGGVDAPVGQINVNYNKEEGVDTLLVELDIYQATDNIPWDISVFLFDFVGGAQLPFLPINEDNVYDQWDTLKYELDVSTIPTGNSILFTIYLLPKNDGDPINLIYLAGARVGRKAAKEPSVFHTPVEFLDTMTGTGLVLPITSVGSTTNIDIFYTHPEPLNNFGAVLGIHPMFFGLSVYTGVKDDPASDYYETALNDSNVIYTIRDNTLQEVTYYVAPNWPTAGMDTHINIYYPRKTGTLAISVNGVLADEDGEVTLPGLLTQEWYQARIQSTTAPTPTSAGVKGNVIINGGFRYECIETNTWIRHAIDTAW